LRLFSFGGYGLALAALALVVFGVIECPPALLSILLVKQSMQLFKGVNQQIAKQNCCDNNISGLRNQQSSMFNIKVDCISD